MSSLYLASLYNSASTNSNSANASTSTGASGSAAASATQLAAISVNLNARLADAATLSSRASDLGTLQASLQTLSATLTALRDSSQTAGITGASDTASVGVLVGANARAGTTQVEVTQLAQAQSNRSDAVATADQAANFGNGTLTIQEGQRAAVSVNITNAMSLSDVANAINKANANVRATVVVDGQTFFLQVTGLDTGSTNGVAFAESGTHLGLVNNGLQAAQDLQGTANGVAFKSATNTTSNAVTGASLSFTQLVSNANVTLAANSTAATAGVTAFVNAYNAALKALDLAQERQSEQGVLNTFRNQLATVVGSYASGAQGPYSALAQVGVRTASDGSLTIDATKLNLAAANDPSSVAALLSGNDGSNGLAAKLQQTSQAFADPATSVLGQNLYGLQALSYRNAQAVLAQADFVAGYAAILSANNTFRQVQLADLTEDALLVQTLPTY